MKDVRTNRDVEEARNMLQEAIEAFEAGKFRHATTIRDVFRHYLEAVAAARGENLGTLAG